LKRSRPGGRRMIIQSNWQSAAAASLDVAPVSEAIPIPHPTPWGPRNIRQRSSGRCSTIDCRRTACALSRARPRRARCHLSGRERGEQRMHKRNFRNGAARPFEDGIASSGHDCSRCVNDCQVKFELLHITAPPNGSKPHPKACFCPIIDTIQRTSAGTQHRRGCKPSREYQCGLTGHGRGDRPCASLRFIQSGLPRRDGRNS
jgi:hypothetical protein